MNDGCYRIYILLLSWLVLETFLVGFSGAWFFVFSCFLLLFNSRLFNIMQSFTLLCWLVLFNKHGQNYLYFSFYSITFTAYFGLCGERSVPASEDPITSNIHSLNDLNLQDLKSRSYHPVTFICQIEHWGVSLMFSTLLLVRHSFSFWWQHFVTWYHNKIRLMSVAVSSGWCTRTQCQFQCSLLSRCHRGAPSPTRDLHQKVFPRSANRCLLNLIFKVF